MSRASRRYAERLSNYYGRREDESGNGECFASTYRQTMGMSPLPQTSSAPVAPAQTDDPLLRSIAECEAQIAKYAGKTWMSAGDKDQLDFYTKLLAKKQAELAARG